MIEGEPCLPPPDDNPAGIPPLLVEFVRRLFADARVLEVWGLAGARLARVECFATEGQTLELDAGDWLLVRVSTSLSTTPGDGIIRFRRVDSEPNVHRGEEAAKT